MRRIGFLSFLVCFAIISNSGFAQSDQTGFPAFSSPAGNINLGNLNELLAIPIFRKDGRGVPVNYALHHNSSIYTIIPNFPNAGQSFYIVPPISCLGCAFLPTFGWDMDAFAGVGYVTSSSVACGSGSKYSSFAFIDPQGTSHPLPSSVVTASDSSCGPAQASGYAVDQSGYFITVNNSGTGFAQSKAGSTFNVTGYPVATIITDRNGNTESLNFQSSSATDTIGVTTLTTSNTTDSFGNTISTAYTYPAPGNTTASVVVNFKVYPRVASGFGCANINEYSISGAGIQQTGGVPLVDNIVLPDGSMYKFQYEPTPSSSPVWVSGAVTGRLQSVTLPTGSTVTYGYPGPNGGVSCIDGTTLRLTRTTSDGTSAYSRSVNSTTAFCSGGVCYQQQLSEVVTATDAQGNQAVIDFMPLANSQISTAVTDTGWIETQRQIYQGNSSGTPLQTLVSCYNGNKTNCSSTAVSMPITEISRLELLANGQQKEQDVFIDGTTGLQTEFDEYDFGSNQPGALSRKTLIKYAVLGNNIISFPQSITVCSPGGSDSACNGAGTRVAQTTFGYDESALATTSVTQHVGVTGSRGNVTSVHRWLNPPGTTLDTINTYDDTGNIITTTDPGLHKTTFTFGGCNGAFLTQTNMPDTNSPNLAHHQSGATYDCNTGLVSTTTDQNGNLTKFFYDNLLRPTETDYADGGQTVASYPDRNHVTVQRKIDGTRSTSSTTVLDGYGRVSRTALANGESTPYDQQDFCYDANGRLGFKSYPYQGNSPSGNPVCPNTSLAGDSVLYDALGRSTKVTHSDGSAINKSYTGRATQLTDEGNGSSNVSRIYQIDGLGRLTNVCEVYGGAALLGGGGAPASCGLDIAGTGFLTSYGYDLLGDLTSVSQGTLTQRSYSYDSLSRMTSETTPEAGTVTYGYDADGLLKTRVRPAPNQSDPTKLFTTTNGYDELHRLTSRTYTSSDPTNDPVNTPGAHFRYDTDPLWANPSAPLTNLIGRVSNAYTDASNAESIFGYDARGRLTINNQCTPSNCGSGNWPLSYTYDSLGDVTSASNGVGVTFNYSYNVAGRLTQMTSSLSDANHPSPLVSGLHYTPSTFTDTLGNGLVETTNLSPRGFVQSYNVSGPTGVPGSGSVVINGTLQTYQQQTQAATPGSGTVTINGTERSKTTNPCLPAHRSCPVTIYDSGPVSITVNGVASSTNYGQGSTTTSIATNLAAAVNNNSNSPVTATSSGSVVTLTSKTGGAATNYSLSASATTSDPTDFGSASFTTSTSGGALSGGQNAVYQTVYDNGSTSIDANGHSDSYSWSGSGTTAASIAQGLCNAINADTGASVTASTNGVAGQCPSGSSTVSLIARQGGAASDYSLSGTSSSSVVNSFSTSCPGFSSCSNADLTGGAGAAYSYVLGLAPDGQVTSANDFVNGNWSFSYDPMNRLASSNKNSGQQTFNYAYDRYSNRWQQNAPQGGPATQQTFDNNNHIQTGISGLTYDVLGNVTNDGFHNYTYDAENRVIQVDGGQTASYVYDAMGQRVSGQNGQYLYDAGGQMITQLSSSGGWNFGEIYAAGRHIATYSGGTTNFMHGDWLGTKRVMTALNGTVSETCTGFMFGDGVNCTGTNWSFNGFTDDIHDPETNLEHTLFRQYSGSEGRWLTVDPGGVASADPSNPQSWNRYAYVMGNPVNGMDRQGLYEWPAGLGPICSNDDTSCDANTPMFAENSAQAGWPFDPGLIVFNAVSDDWQIPYQSLGDQLRQLLAGLPWNNPCIMSPISDGCGFGNNLEDLKGPNDPMNDGARFCGDGKSPSVCEGEDWSTFTNDLKQRLWWGRQSACQQGQSQESFGNGELAVLQWIGDHDPTTIGSYLVGLRYPLVGAVMAKVGIDGEQNKYMGRATQWVACPGSYAPGFSYYPTDGYTMLDSPGTQRERRPLDAPPPDQVPLDSPRASEGLSPENE
jgi:RHS repeat-associated protein